jgi:hypothetical protein
MNFTFSSPQHGACVVKLWATGRYGFTLPKKVEIATPAGQAFVFLYFNKRLRLAGELTNRAIVRIAVAAFLAGGVRDGAEIALDPEGSAYDGALTPVRLDAPRAPLRVRPGKSYGWVKTDADADADPA